jgi:hypothetical protein
MRRTKAEGATDETQPGVAGTKEDNHESVEAYESQSMPGNCHKKHERTPKRVSPLTAFFVCLRVFCGH